MAEVPEKSLERYDVLDRIAVGGMAEVFLAKAYGAHGFEKTLAIKRILPELARDPEFEERFIAEAKVAVKLSHSNVVQVFDFGRFAGSLFIAMEYVDGLDLAALLRRFKERHEKVPLPAAFQIAIELARGLDFAHTHGVVHRDVSPSNILLSKAGEVKIADFGIAVAAQPGKVAAAAGRRKVMGKWRYMSPEQARGEPLDTRSDMFSAASVMYELFTGDKLFPGDEAEDIIRNIEEMVLPKPSEVRRGLPPRLDEILHQALARKPIDRPLRPAVMLRALTELTYESSIVTTAVDVAEAVNYVVDLSTPTGKRLDDIIRAQLANVAEKSVVRQTARGERKTGVDVVDLERRTAQGTLTEDPDRRTAVTIIQRRGRTSSSESALTDAVAPPTNDAEAALAAIDESRPVLLPHVDSDGITRLELDATTMTAAPWELRGEPPAMPGRAGDGTPPAARGGRAPTAGASLTQIVRARSEAPAARKVPVVALGLIVAVIAAAGAYVVTRKQLPATPIAEAAPDAAVPSLPVAPLPALLIIETVPVGAIGTAGGKPFGPTPARLEVTPGTIPVRIELAGHEPYVDDHVVVGAGQTMVLRATLAPALARLIVITEPPGVNATLDGVELGQTPSKAGKLTPRRGARLTLSKAGYVTASFPVDLEPGKDTRIERTLREAPTPTGLVKISVSDAEGPLLGDIYLAGRKIGEAGAQGLRLPIGKHKLRVVTRDGRDTSIDVEVNADQTHVYTARVP